MNSPDRRASAGVLDETTKAMDVDELLTVLNGGRAPARLSDKLAQEAERAIGGLERTSA